MQEKEHEVSSNKCCENGIVFAQTNWPMLTPASPCPLVQAVLVYVLHCFTTSRNFLFNIFFYLETGSLVDIYAESSWHRQNR